MSDERYRAEVDAWLDKHCRDESGRPHSFNGRIRLPNADWMTLTEDKPNECKILDIAIGLGRLGRYGCLTNKEYSVAEHSVLMTRAAMVDGHSEYASEVLLHDAAEAYGLGDLVAPFKRMCDAYNRIEYVITRKIQNEFELRPEAHSLVKEYDNAIRPIEQQALWPTKLRMRGAKQPMSEGMQAVEICFLDRFQASLAFIELAQEIGLADQSDVEKVRHRARSANAKRFHQEMAGQ